MVILLPTFGFTSMLTVLNTVLSHNSTSEIEWECIFLPDSGAFFVNYLITAALFGCAVMTGVGAVINTARIRSGDSVAILGLGGVGLNGIMGAKLGGAETIIGIDIDETKF